MTAKTIDFWTRQPVRVVQIDDGPWPGQYFAPIKDKPGSWEDWVDERELDPDRTWRWYWPSEANSEYWAALGLTIDAPFVSVSWDLHRELTAFRSWWLHTKPCTREWLHFVLFDPEPNYSEAPAYWEDGLGINTDWVEDGCAFATLKAHLMGPVK